MARTTSRRGRPGWRRQPRFRLDPKTGRPVRAGRQEARGKRVRRGYEGELDEPQVITDPYSGAPTINVFLTQGGGGPQYPVGAFTPEARPVTVTDRSRLDLAGQVGNL